MAAEAAQENHMDGIGQRVHYHALLLHVGGLLATRLRPAPRVQELPKCRVVGTRSRMGRGCRCQRNSNLNNTQFVGGECMGRARVWLVPTRVAGALLAGSLLSQGAFVRPAAAQTCSAAMATMSAADNLQLGSQVAGPGQRQLRIEADYVTCTQ